MKRFLTFSMLILFFRITLAQVAVSISVVDNLNNAAVKGATVTLTEALVPVIKTDSLGIAKFTVPTPTESYKYLTYTVTAPGFLNYSNSWLYITDTNPSATSTAYIQKAFNIAFKITNHAGENIENASVKILSAPDSTRFTDASGEVTFNGLYTTGTHEYIVSAEGYADSTATVQITKDSAETVTVPAIKLIKAYNISFTVSNGTNPVDGAVVTIGNESKPTGVDGSVSFAKKINGTYSYLITKNGFVDYTSSVTVNDGDAMPAVTLTQGFDLTFAVINGESGEVGLQQDTITINDITKITGESGMLTFGVAAGSNIAFTNTKAGFKTVPVNIENVQKDTVLTIYMKPDYKIRFTVYNGKDFTLMQGASVKLGEMEVITDENGVAAFSGIEPNADPYEFKVNGPAGTKFTQQSGTVEMPISSFSYLWDNNNMERTIYLTEPYVFIGLGGWMSYFGAATITFEGVDYEYDQGLGGNIFNVDGPGTYSYTVTPADESMAVVSGTATVTETESASVYVDIVPGRKIELYVVNSAQEPIEGAVVKLNGAEVVTDDSGLAQYNRYADGIYNYSVSMENFNSIVDAALDVNLEDVLEIITLTHGVTVTFHIGNNGNALENISVKMNGVSVLSDKEGNAVFTEVDAGSYIYTATMSGYNALTGEVSVSDADITENVELTITAVKEISESSLSVYPNPTSGITYITLPRFAGNQDVRVVVMNSSGSVMMDKKYKASQQIRLDLSDKSTGIYYIKVIGENIENSMKVMKN